MSERNTVIRSLHDIGLDAWFGGSLMGVIGLNGAAAKAKDPTERLRLSSLGWARWAPVQLGAIALYGVGSVGLLLGDKGRQAVQDEARTNSALTIVFTGLAGTASVLGAIAGTVIGKSSAEGAPGVTESSAANSDGLKAAQRVEKVTQWAIPILTGVIVVLHAQQGELQRPAAGIGGTISKRAKGLLGR